MAVRRNGYDQTVKRAIAKAVVLFGKIWWDAIAQYETAETEEEKKAARLWLSCQEIKEICQWPRYLEWAHLRWALYENFGLIWLSRGIPRGKDRRQAQLKVARGYTFPVTPYDRVRQVRAQFLRQKAAAERAVFLLEKGSRPTDYQRIDAGSVRKLQADLQKKKFSLEKALEAYATISGRVLEADVMHLLEEAGER